MQSSTIHSLDDAVERLYDLHVGVVGKAVERHERPHKPVLLLAALDLIASGKASPDCIAWSTDLRERFADYFAVVQARDDKNTPENPFRWLQTDKIWSPFEMADGATISLQREPLVGDCDTGKVWASMSGGLEKVVLTPDDRMKVRFALIERFFPYARKRLEGLFGENPETPGESVPDDGDEAASHPGRNQAFRRKILEIYDCQCAACGLRIKMPEVSDLTFVDAAHIIPFRESYNDHPTNGLALCKNHHWAMDRSLIAPCPDRAWRASPRLIAHRSIGEKELLSLNGQPILPPADEVFLPSPEALEWRQAQLVR